MLDRVKIGTRGSPLALAQANMVRDMLIEAHPSLKAVDIVVIKTTGDMVLDRPLSQIGGKGLFTKEIEDQLLEGSIDLAVHSSKDMPTTLPDGLIMPVFLEREDPRDAFIGANGVGLMDLPAASIIGTASLRRQAQVLRARPDVKVVTLRGNVGTRLDKIKSDKLGGTLLAAAGLNRLGLSHKATEILNCDIMLPAPAQGAVGIEVRVGDAGMLSLLEALHHFETAICVECERSLLAQLDGSCRTPIAALAKFDGKAISLEAKVFSLDGKKCFSADGTKLASTIEEAKKLGKDLGQELLDKAGEEFFVELKFGLAKLQS
jgi:hydroxymethylbilane synthase